MDLRPHDMESEGDGQANEPIEVVDVNENDDEISQKNKQIVDRLKQIILDCKTSDGILLKKVNKRSPRAQTVRVNSVVKFVKTKNITDTNKLINAASAWVAEQMVLKKFEIGQRKEPWWKRRLENDIKNLKHDINVLQRRSKGELGSKKSGN